MMTWSPLKRKGVYRGVCFPVKMVAALVAIRPSTWSLASITYHLPRADNSPAVKNLVDMLSPSKQPMCKRFDSIGATYIMSSRPVLVLMAFSSILMLPGAAQNTSNTDVSDLLLSDEVQQAENILDKQQKTPQTTALRGEIEFRKGHFDPAEALYREAL